MAVTGRGALADTGVAAADLLVDFADALVLRDEPRLAKARAALRDAVGDPGFVDAAGVAGFFNAIDRVADATGTQIDETTFERTVELRDALGIHEFREGKQ